MTEKLLEIIRRDSKYSGFTLIEKPTPFNKLFKGKNYRIVEVYSSTIFQNTLVGFCGSFKWKDGRAIALDFDSYDPEMNVIGYQYRKEEKVLDILIEGDW